MGGSGDGWNKLGFETVQILPPSMWVVSTVGTRTSLVVTSLELPFLDDLAKVPTEDTLRQHGYVPIYGAGMARLFLVVNQHSDARELWECSVPRKGSSYWSNYPGIDAMLRKVEELDNVSRSEIPNW